MIFSSSRHHCAVWGWFYCGFPFYPSGNPASMSTCMSEMHAPVCNIHQDQGPVFLFIFCPWERLSWAEISWAEHKFTDFVFFVFVWAELTVSKLTKLQVIVSKLGRCLTSPWAGLSKAELCNNGPYLDARTDRISPHNPPTPSRIPKKILFQGFLQVEARSPLTNLPWYADRLLRVIIVCFVT